MTSVQPHDNSILGFFSEIGESSNSDSSNSQNSRGQRNIIYLPLSKIFGKKKIKNISKRKKREAFKRIHKRKYSRQNDFQQVDQNKDQDQKQLLFNEDRNQSQKPQDEIDSKTKQPKYVYPGETKNLYYNICQNLKHFIQFNFDEQQIKSQAQIIKFLESPKRLGYFEFKRMMKESLLLQQIARIFFSQFGWARFFILNNRVDLEQYFRYKPTFLIEKR